MIVSERLSKGILVLSTESDWHKAYAMILSMRNFVDDLPVAVVGTSLVLQRLQPVTDVQIPEDPALKGFEHKLALDKYTPFKATLFVDADMLWFGSPYELIEKMSGYSYGVRGDYRGGVSSFGLCRDQVLERTGKPAFVNISGAGHAYFTLPEAVTVFERSRAILKDYNVIAPGAGIADEDIVGIAMTELDIPPIKDKNIVGFIKAAKPNTLKIDVCDVICEYVDLKGDRLKPVLMHFPRDMTPFFYTKLMKKLVAKYGADLTVNWCRKALHDWWLGSIRARLSTTRKKVLGLIRL